MLEQIPAEKRKKSGIHYTPPRLANFVAAQILNASKLLSSPKKLRVMDPAVGDGQLLLSLVEQLSAVGTSDFDVSGFDTSSIAIEAAKSRLERRFPTIKLELACDDFLEFVLTNYAPNGQYSLFASTLPESFDLIIANPPYVRTQVMGQTKAQTIAQQFGLSGRVDLYYAFIEGIAQVLRPGGIAGIIVSNRFLTTKSGVSVRQGLAEKFDILHIWDLGDTQIFEAAVLPAVLLLKRKNGEKPSVQPRFTSIYSAPDATPNDYAPDVIAALAKEGVVEVEGQARYRVQQGNLDYDDDPANVWRITNEASEKCLAKVKENTFCTFGDVGKIRVGVKTTADKVFIRSDWQEMLEEEKPELLRPLMTHHIARRFKPAESDEPRQILYPHQVVDGKRVAVDLTKFPRAAKYLHAHRAVLEKREYVMKSGRQWYEVWVPQDPDLWQYPKVVFRDITDKPMFWLDLQGAVVNGDCYWLVSNNHDDIDLLWLVLAVANSSFIETFYDYRFNNKLYSGRRRFITQYVEKFPLPDPQSNSSHRLVQITKQLYDSLASSSQSASLERELDALVWAAFGFSVEEVASCWMDEIHPLSYPYRQIFYHNHKSMCSYGDT